MKWIRILALGDVIGNKGVEVLSKYLPNIKESKGIDLVIVNGENASFSGVGILEKEYNLLISSGVDIITTGNHVWAKKEIHSFIERANKLIRPLNYNPSLPGRGSIIIEVRGVKVCVMNALGSVLMDAPFISPFFAVEKELELVKNDTNIVILDFHAEATSEKILMGWFLDGKVSLVYGTHTHVQTADEKILPKGTGYITDIGMCGFSYSVIGSKIDDSLKRITLGLPEKLNPSTEGEFLINGIICDIDVNDGKTLDIQRFNLEISV
ncbi:MAG: TIGR00282 family metallophosphoesterase [Brevinematia bacterium]